jgi:integrase
MRRPKPWFRSQTNSWYVELGGNQHPLGVHPEGYAAPKKSKAGWNAPEPILSAFYALMAGDPATLTKTKDLLTSQVCDLFLDHASRHNEPATYAWYKSFLQDFCDHYGKVPAADLKPIHVTRWLDAHPDWKGGRRNAVAALKRAFNFADQQGVLSPNPLRAVQKPSQGRRTRVLTEAERDEILAAIKDQKFRDFVFALQQTGCRPSEVARLTAADVNLELGVWVLAKHKAATHTQRPRVVYLNPVMLEMSRTLVAKRPEGPLFPSFKLGRPFTKNAIRIRFRRLRKKLPHLKHFVCYNLRHTYATDALAKGLTAAQVAELLGHTSIRMVERHYGHLSQKVGAMREAAAKAAT